MGIFELVIGLLCLGTFLALWANRKGLPYPALLALVGALLALVPGTPEVRLDAELALALFVAPTLLDAAYDASPRDLRRNLVPQRPRSESADLLAAEYRARLQAAESDASGEDAEHDGRAWPRCSAGPWARSARPSRGSSPITGSATTPSTPSRRRSPSSS